MRLEFKGDGKGFLLPVKTKKDPAYSQTGVAFQNTSNFPLLTFEQAPKSDLWVKFDIKQATGNTKLPNFCFQVGRSALNGHADIGKFQWGSSYSNAIKLQDGINTVLVRFVYWGGSWTHKAIVWLNGDSIFSDVVIDLNSGVQNFWLFSGDKNVWFSNIIVSDTMIGFDEVVGDGGAVDDSGKTKGCYLTKDELEPYQNIMDELTMEDAKMATSLIDGYLGRSFEPAQFTDRVKLNRGRGKLSHSPVVNVEKVIAVSRTMFGKVKGEVPPEVIELDPEMDGYFTYEDNSSDLTSLVFRTVPEMLLVTYNSGFEEYPQRLKDACGMLACNIRQAKSFAGAKQLTSLDFQVLMTDDSFFTSDIKLLLRGLIYDVRNV